MLCVGLIQCYNVDTDSVALSNPSSSSSSSVQLILREYDPAVLLVTALAMSHLL